MDDKAVSPLIGVMLMVAITVILAACVAAFIFALAPPLTIHTEDKIAVTVIDRYSYDGVNLYLDVVSNDASGAVIHQTFWTTDPVMFHHIESGQNYVFTVRPPYQNKYPSVIGVS